MQEYAADYNSSTRAAVYMALAALLACCALLVGTDASATLVVALAVALLPFLGYLALIRPMVFPFGLYVVLIPFDNLLVTGSGGTVTKLLGIVSGIFILLWAVRTSRTVMPDRSVFALIGFLAWAIVSTLWAVDQQASLAILPTYGGLILLYGALSITKITTAQFRTIVYLVIAGGIIAALYGANAFFHQPPTALQATDGRLILQSGRNSIDPNHFADALLLPAAAVITCGLGARRLLGKLLALAGLGVIAAAILLSGSREALLAIVLIVLYQAWRSRYRLQLIAGAAVTAVVAMSVQTSLWERFSSVFTTGGSGRLAIWSVGLEAFKHDWLTGYGIGTFPAVYDMYYLSVYQFYTNGWTSPAHNIVVHYLVELGIVGMACICAFYWLRFSSLRCIPPGSSLYDYRVMMESSLIAIAAVSLSIDLFTYKYAWLVFSMAALLRNAAPPTYTRVMRLERSAMMAARL